MKTLGIVIIVILISIIVTLWFVVQAYQVITDSSQETMLTLVEAIEQRNELLNQAYTDITTLEEQMTADEQYYEQQMEIAQRAAGQAQFTFYYVLAGQRYGVVDLHDYLRRSYWEEGSYVEDKFDCSQMSAYLEWKLENEGYHTIIVAGNSPDGSGKHAWLLVETSKGRYVPVEATAYSIVDGKSPDFYRYFEYEYQFETIQEALSYSPTEFNWWD